MREVSAFQPRRAEGLNYGLVAYWRLNGLTDEMGTYTLTNNGSVTFSTGKIDNGAVFSNSTTQSLTRASVPFGTAGTIAFWAFINTGDTGGYFHDASSANRYYFYYDSSGGGGVSLNGAAGPTISASAITFNQYNHIVITWDNSLGSDKIKVFINDSQYGTSNNAISASTPATFYIGNRYSNTGVQDSMNGVIDEFGVWNRALSSTEISELYNSGSGKQLPSQILSTKAYYPLNGSSTDFSGNGNHGTDTSVTYPQGRFGQGARFNGSSSKISATITGQSTFTALCWFQSIANGQYILVRRNAGNNANYNITFNGNKLQISSFDGTNYLSIDSVQNIILGRWYSVVAVFSGASSRLYINGNYENSGTLGTFTSGNDFYLGANATASFFNGYIDEVIIENRAWSAQEIETYYRKSVLNYRQKSFAQMIYTYTDSLLKGTYTLTGKNLTTLQNYVRQLLKGTYTVTGKNLTVAKQYMASLLKGAYTLTGKILTVPTTWIGRTKHSATWTNRSKNSSTWTNRSKNSSTWTNRPKS